MKRLVLFLLAAVLLLAEGPGPKIPVIPGSTGIASVAGTSGRVTASTAGSAVTLDTGANIPTLDGDNAFAGIISNTPSAAQTIDAAGDAILANATVVRIDPDASYTLTSTPTIADGATDGQRLEVYNIDTTYAVTLQSGSTYNLCLSAPLVPIRATKGIALRWLSTQSCWYQEAQNVSPIMLSAGWKNAGTNSTTVTTSLHSFTIPGGTLAIGDIVRCRTSWLRSATSETTVRVSGAWGGTAPSAGYQGTTTSFQYDFDMFVTGAATQKGLIRTASTGGNVGLSSATWAPTSAISGDIEVQLRGYFTPTNAGNETITLEMYACELVKGL